MARRVVLVHSSAGRYGADRQLGLLAAGLAGSGWEALAVLPDTGPLADDLARAGVAVHVRPQLAVLRRAEATPAGLARLAARTARDAIALGRLVRRRRAALVHSNTSVTLGGAAAARAAGVPHVWHVRELYADAGPGWPLHRRLLASADALPCVSRAVRDQFGASPRARVLPDGLALAPRPLPRPQARARLGLPPDAFVVLLAARLADWKGQDVLLRALADPALTGVPAVAVLAGDAWPGREAAAAELRALAARLGLGERARFVGFCDDVDALYGAADVVAVPSTRPDPLPNAALEAAAAGRCVVASAHGGLPEIVAHGRTGVLVAPGDPAALAVALAGLAGDPDRRARLGAAAATDVRARFSPAALVQGVLALYAELTGAQPDSPAEPATASAPSTASADSATHPSTGSSGERRRPPSSTSR